MPARPQAAAATANSSARFAIMASSLKIPAARWLFRLDICRLDDRPPFFDFGFVESTERLGILLVARGDVLAEVGEALAHAGIGQGIDDRRIELADDVLARRLRHPEPVPDRGIESRQSGLIDGRNLGRRRKPRLG